MNSFARAMLLVQLTICFVAPPQLRDARAARTLLRVAPPRLDYYDADGKLVRTDASGPGERQRRIDEALAAADAKLAEVLSSKYRNVDFKSSPGYQSYHGPGVSKEAVEEGHCRTRGNDADDPDGSAYHDPWNSRVAVTSITGGGTLTRLGGASGRGATGIDSWARQDTRSRRQVIPLEKATCERPPATPCTRTGCLEATHERITGR